MDKFYSWILANWSKRRHTRDCCTQTHPLILDACQIFEHTIILLILPKKTDCIKNILMYIGSTRAKISKKSWNIDIFDRKKHMTFFMTLIIFTANKQTL